MTPGTRIKELRVIADMSQEELGRRVGVQRAAIQKYENGSVENIPLKTIEKIARVFDVSPTYIVGWDESANNPLAVEVKIVQGVKTFFGMEALELLETYLALDKFGRKRLVQYSDEAYKLYKL